VKQRCKESRIGSGLQDPTLMGRRWRRCRQWRGRSSRRKASIL